MKIFVQLHLARNVIGLQLAAQHSLRQFRPTFFVNTCCQKNLSPRLALQRNHTAWACLTAQRAESAIIKSSLAPPPDFQISYA
jgi:hypothetical protein